MTRQQIELEIYSNPLMTREVLFCGMKKKNLVLGFWWMTSCLGYVLGFFMTLSTDPMSRFRGSKFYWKVGYNTSL